MSDLLPCPFCGGEAKWVSGGPGSAYVSCMSCPAETGDGSIPRIAAAWNRRTVQAQIDAAVKAERERCAAMIEATAYTNYGDIRTLEPVSLDMIGMDMHHATIAAAIRKGDQP